MIIPSFIGSIALGGAAGLSSLVAAVIARRATREADDMRKMIPQWNQLRDLESLLATAKSELGQLDARRVELAAQVQRSEELSSRVLGLEQHIAELEAMRDSLAPMESEHQRLAQLIAQLHQDRIAAEKQIHDAKQEVERERERAAEQISIAEVAKLDVAIAQRRRDELNSESEVIRAKVAALEARVSGLQSEIAQLSAQESGLRNLVIQHERELAEARDRMAEAHAKHAVLESRIAELTSEEGGLRKALAALEEKLRDLSVELAKLEAERAGLSAAIDGLQREIERLREEKTRTAADAQQLSQQLADMRASATGGSFTLFEAMRDLFEPQIEHKRAAGSFSSEEAAVQAVAAHAKSLGFWYPDRVIRAFHTSLTLGRQAPLLVLAGISGTGKSQLPRLYCDALGINFLPMAVQPGWDSPADLVGFFSHIEHRFKPTPLSRALVQMDEYMGQSLDRLVQKEFDRFTQLRQPCEGELLLVLLDEMNLARVEYYFSDFLSRLELRNSAGFDPADEEHRRRVQLMLEAPGAKDALKHVALFPGDNVLFVGTMNEDESTMALSDKVIDRANVLRFGKPETLKAETGGRGASSEKCLTLKQWRQWTRLTEERPADAERVRTIAEWTARLNESLDSVQRSFAHRTAGAIKSYCLAYSAGVQPKENKFELKSAFADQVEQRVMPKLRGVDPSSPDGQQAMQGVQSLIEELADAELLDAFNRGLRANEGQSFVWYGTRRKADA